VKSEIDRRIAELDMAELDMAASAVAS